MRNRMFRMRFETDNNLGITPEEKIRVTKITAHLNDGSKVCNIRIFNSDTENASVGVPSLRFFSAGVVIQSLRADQINLESLVGDSNLPLEIAEGFVEANDNCYSKFLN